MLINKDIAISTSRVLLVPYEPHHVPTYHEWMQDPLIQEATASEPLSLEEEYAMQRSWRTDSDKLTFIACTPVDHLQAAKASHIQASIDDSPESLIGDVNLFLSTVDEDPAGVAGELELMIAPENKRRQGFGRATVVAFMHYIDTHLDDILGEFARSISGAEAGEKLRLVQLTVKVGSKNQQSINLFESLGFIRTIEGENYFGEVELCYEGFLGKERTAALMVRWGVTDWTELTYKSR